MNSRVLGWLECSWSGHLDTEMKEGEWGRRMGHRLGGRDMEERQRVLRYKSMQN